MILKYVIIIFIFLILYFLYKFKKLINYIDNNRWQFGYGYNI